MNFTARLQRMMVWTALASGCIAIDIFLVRDSGALLSRLFESVSPYSVIGGLAAAMLTARMALFIYEGIRGAQEESRHRSHNLLGPWPGV